jgi:chromosome segregation protein
MRLVSLEVKGFKSFADKQVVNFEGNVLGIVGPNGCGKSNIVDAIRWVLGEQKSKELRSDKMENIIFNGTKNRKQSNLAEVSLTFENNKGILPTEYNMVTIKRILYRDGESEYRLNDVKCRLKDIATLLSDTGIGSDSYAIIALGMVDDLLNDKENARRKLFEQAAGISKFKLRKRETLQKLESAQQDLARVEDLVYEIEQNLKVLEKQAKRAKRFFEMKEEYKELSVDLTVIRLSGLKKDYKHLEKLIGEAEATMLELDALQNKLEAALQHEKSQNIEVEILLTEKQKELNAVVGRIRGLENDKKMLAQKQLFVQENGNELGQRISLAENKVKELKNDEYKLEDSVKLEETILKNLNRDLEDLKDIVDEIRDEHKMLQSDLDANTKKSQAQQDELFEVEKQIAFLNSRAEMLRNDVNSTEANLAKRNDEYENLLEQKKNADERQSKQEILLQELENEELKRSKALEAAEHLQVQYRDENVKNNRQLDQKRNEFKLLKSMVDNLEGFPESIKYLSKDSNWKVKAPLLSDLIYVKESYRSAVENFLEPFLNYYVVETLAQAIEAIEMLDSNNKGKANFFIMNELESKELHSPFVEQATPALSVIEISDNYRMLINHLLHNVFISELGNAETLKHLLSKTNPDLVLLSKTGSFIKRPNALFGGSVGLFEGKRIGRKKNLEVLEVEIKQLEEHALQVQRHLDKVNQEINQLKQSNKSPEIRQAKDLLDRILRDSFGLKNQLDNHVTFQAEAQIKIDSANAEVETIYGQLDKLDLEAQNIQTLLTSTKNDISQKDYSFKHIAERLTLSNSHYNQKNIEFIRQQNKISGITRELGYVKQQAEQTLSQLTNDTNQLQKSDSELKNSVVELRNLSEDLVKDYENRKIAEKNLQTSEQNFQEARKHIVKIEEELRQANRKKQDHIQYSSTQQQKFSEIKLEINTINERIQVEFNLSVNDLINREPNPELDKKELTERVETMRQRIYSYGEINPMALEAYEEMKERYDFIQQQREDLTNARNSLQETIAEIESKATELFTNAFEQVRANFQIVFRSLFTEDDSCDLILSDPENPLDSHINIIAKPKGKRPLTINQLSGGEKTLTATALLFSLYLLKPAPFCIFDEVDAPLDDANIAKFNNIIKKFSNNSQFIIVTHNKSTMASVELIYGVTMDQPGISKVVPVDFRSLA